MPETEANAGTAGVERATKGSTSPDVIVIGAGVIGVSIAWELVQSGRAVVVVDPAPGSGATFAAAGMIAPVNELHYQEDDLLQFMVASAHLYPNFADRLAGSSYRISSTLTVGVDPADRRALLDLRDVQASHGLHVSPLTMRSARQQEPLLAANLSCAFTTEADHSIDPRQLLRSIHEQLNRCDDRQYRLLHQQVVGLLRSPTGAVNGVRFADQSQLASCEVVVANGLGARHLQGLPTGLKLPLRPVHGDILRLMPPTHLQPFIGSTIRGSVRGFPIYLVPREDGSVVIGATQREDDNAGISAGGVYQLLRDAQVIVPAVAELELIEVTARARPATPDNAPLLGRVAGVNAGRATNSNDAHIPGLIVATGFYRHGVLLAPLAARRCVELVDAAGASPPPHPRLNWAALDPARFSTPNPETS